MQRYFQSKYFQYFRQGFALQCFFIETANFYINFPNSLNDLFFILFCFQINQTSQTCGIEAEVANGTSVGTTTILEHHSVGSWLMYAVISIIYIQLSYCLTGFKSFMVPLWLLKVLKGSHVLGGLFCTVDLYSHTLKKGWELLPRRFLHCYSFKVLD